MQLKRSSTLSTVEYTESIHHSWSRIYSLVSDDRGLLWALEESEVPDLSSEEEISASEPSSRLLACMVAAIPEAEIAAALWTAANPGGSSPDLITDITPLGKAMMDAIGALKRRQSRRARIYLHPMN